MDGASRPPAALVGKQYRILVELGHGGTSDVYLAVASSPSGFNKLVVLKALKSEIARERAARRAFLSEARLSARLNHPNVVQVNEVLEQDEIPILVMEYLEGRALAQILGRAWARFPLALHLRVLSDALRGLHYSHELCDFDGTPLSVVHRDMSPHNIFVTFDGQVKVLDFGLAKIGGSADTQTGVVRGKLHYMSPDQLTQDRDLDRRADVYAVGVMLWEAATGRRLWEGLSDPVILRRVLDGRVPTPSSLNPRVPAALERICMRALALRPEDRQSTAADLAAELDEFLAGLGGAATSRAVGEFVADVFAEDRRSMRRIVEEKLRADDSVTGSIARGISLAARRDGSGSLKNFAAPTQTVTNLPVRRRLWSREIAVAVAVLLTAGAVTVYRSTSGVGHPAAVAAAPTPIAATLPSVRPATLRITAFPSAARVLIDGQDTGENPCVREVPVGMRVSLRVEADGHFPIDRELHVTKDQELVLSLQPIVAHVSLPSPASSPPPRLPTRSRGASVPAPPPALPPVLDCSPPYYLDSRGVKKFKPECL
jgi:hypothetical protein